MSIIRSSRIEAKDAYKAYKDRVIDILPMLELELPTHEDEVTDLIELEYLDEANNTMDLVDELCHFGLLK